MIEIIQQGLQAEGLAVSINKLSRWFEGPRRTAYYRPLKSPPKLRERLVAPIKVMIEQNSSFGYRTEGSPAGVQQKT